VEVNKEKKNPTKGVTLSGAAGKKGGFDLIRFTLYSRSAGCVTTALAKALKASWLYINQWIRFYSLSVCCP